MMEQPEKVLQLGETGFLDLVLKKIMLNNLKLKKSKKVIIQIKLKIKITIAKTITIIIIITMIQIILMKTKKIKDLEVEDFIIACIIKINLQQMYHQV